MVDKQTERKNEATWRCRELCDHESNGCGDMNFFSEKITSFNEVTLTFIHDLDVVNVHHHTKFGDPTSNGSHVMNFFLVIFF